MQQARLLEEQITDVPALLRHVAAEEGNGDGHAYHLKLVEERPEELVIRTIEAKTGLATTHHVRRAALEANEYRRLADVHRDLDALTGTPPFTITLGDNTTDAASFEDLHDEVLAIAQKGIDYYRFKGLGEMDAEELRETTMDPETRTLVQVTMEDAASADLVFSMLMGDQVEPRRAFIEENARLVDQPGHLRKEPTHVSDRHHRRRQHRASRARGGDALGVSRLRHVGHRRARAARRARRPEAGPPPRPARDERAGPAAQPQARQVRPDRRRGDGQVPSPRRHGHLRHAGPHGAGLLHALPARRRPRQLRQHRRLGARPPCATPRRAWSAWPPRCCATSTPRPSTSRPPTTARARSRSCCRRASRTCWSTAAPGIAVGMATNIPPHNLREVVAATIAYIDDPQIDVEGLMQPHQGPRLPDRRARSSVARASATRTPPAAAACGCRPRRTSSRSARARRRSSSPSCPSRCARAATGGLIEKIADLVHDKKIPEITDLRDESDRRGMRLVIELKRDAIPKVVLNKLHKHTPMQTTFGVNMVALVDNVPRTLSLREVIGHYVDHQREVIVRRTKYELRRSEERAHVLEGQLIALANLDEVIALIRGVA